MINDGQFWMFSVNLAEIVSVFDTITVAISLEPIYSKFILSITPFATEVMNSNPSATSYN